MLPDAQPGCNALVQQFTPGTPAQASICLKRVQAHELAHANLACLIYIKIGGTGFVYFFKEGYREMVA
jgi:hypothetical protein